MATDLLDAATFHQALRRAVLAVLALSLAACRPSSEQGAASGGAAGGEIVRVSRQNNSGTYHYFREAVLGKDREYKLGSIDQSGSKDVVTLVSKTPNAVGYSGMAYATPEVKMLKVSRKKGEPAALPNEENATSGAYPISRPLLLYTIGEPRGIVKDYIGWIRSDEGQKVVGEIGYVPVESTGPWSGPASDEEGVLNVTGSDTMVNLGQKWAEEYRKRNPKVIVQVAGGGSGVGIAALIDGKCQIANSSRKMKPAEIARLKNNHGVDPREFVVGLDALAVYVHKDNPLDAISLEELAEIYGEDGTIERWSQLEGWPKE